MITLKRATTVTPELIKEIEDHPHCRIGSGVVIEDGVSIYLDPGFKRF